MKTNSKEVTEKVRQHILDSVYDYNENEFANIDLANEHLASEFKRVADYPNNLQRIPNNSNRFEDYLRGIPFHFEFEDYKIEEFLNGLGINPQGKEYSSDEMWKLYSYLIWKEVSKKYHNYKKGGSTFKGGGEMGKTYHLTGVSVDYHEDSYEEGELDHFHSYYLNESEFPYKTKFTNKEDLFKTLSEFVGYGTDYSENDFFVDEGTIQVSALVKYQKDSDWDEFSEPTEADRELWKKGKKKLYNAQFSFTYEVYKKEKAEFEHGGSTFKGGGEIQTDLIAPKVKEVIDSKNLFELRKQFRHLAREMKAGLLSGAMYEQEKEYLRHKIYEAKVKEEKAEFNADLNNPARKTVTLYYVQGNYGYGDGWEDLTAHDSKSEAQAELEVYDENERYPHRLITRRVQKNDYSIGNYEIGGEILEVVDYDMEAGDLDIFKTGGKTKPYNRSWHTDRLWTSQEPHEQAYKKKRKSAIRDMGKDRKRDSQEPHEVARRRRNKKYLMGGDLDHIMFMAGGSVESHMGASDLEEFAKGGNVQNKPRLKRGDKVFMICRRWFQQTYGNTYHSVDVFVNNELVGRLPFEYGYGDHCLTTGLKTLFDVYSPPYNWSDRSESGVLVNSAKKLKDFGIKFTYEIIDVTRKKDLELGGLIDDLKPERDLIVPFGKGGEIMSKLTAGDFISENEMKLITRRMNNDQLDDEMREVIQYIWDNDVAIDPNSDWSKKGLKFLMNQYKSPTGKERVSNPFGYREADILENFDHFELVGFHDISRYGGVSYFVPLYDVCDKDGFCFQYYFDGKVHIIGMFGGLFGAEKKPYNRSWHTDRLWTSQEPHEQAYKKKRKSAIRNMGKDRKLDSQEPHEVARRRRNK